MHSEKLMPQEIVLDVNRQYLQPSQARFIKNVDFDGKDGGGMLVVQPLQSNEVYDPSFTLPAGDNLKVGSRSCSETNELYVLVFNSNGSHVLYRIVNGGCQMVFVGPELELSNDPQYYVDETRFQVKRICIGDRTRTFAVWTNGLGDQKHVCVDDSIATGYFDPVRFPYFKQGGQDRKILVNLGVPTPVDCMGIAEVATNTDKINRLKKHAWRFRVKFIDVYGRPSEHGQISNLYYQSDCYADNIGCLDLSFDAGGPLVDKVQVEYNNTNTTAWSIDKTLQKYKRCDKEWWLRDINSEDFTFNAATNTITYRFCPGGECIPVPDAEIQRGENPLPVRSQSLFPLAGGIGLANNQYGRGPFSCDLLDNIKFTVEPVTTNDPVLQTRNIVIYVPIFNAYENYPEGLWNFDDHIVFGGVGVPGYQIGTPGSTLAIDDKVAGKFGQYFADGQEGFVGYMAGTKYACVSRQYKAQYDNSGKIVSWTKDGVARDKGEIYSHRYMQRFEFNNVPPGKYVFRIADHKAKLNDPNYQRTSTFVAGTCAIKNNAPDPARLSDDRELAIDVCSKDYDSLSDGRSLLIWDMTHPELSGQFLRNSRVVAGYVYESRDNNGAGVLPVEQATVVIGSASIDRRVNTTDHNGFYFAGARDGNWIVGIGMYHNCSWQVTDRFRVTADGLTSKDFIAEEQWPAFPTNKCSRTIVTGTVKDCITGALIPNVVVGITRGQFVSTDLKGEFHLIAHDREGGRKDSVLLMPAGTTCLLTACNGDPCFPTLDYNQVSCTTCTDRAVVVGSFAVALKGINRRGLSFGGRYAFGVNGGDWMDRENFAQVKPEWFIDMPTINKLQSFNYPRIKWVIDPAARFPLWMKRLHFRVSQNLSFSDFLMWVVDRFEFIDNTGLENKITPTQIKVHYSSLGEYNKQNNFATNSTWQIIDAQDSATTKDTVQFIANGDGKIFPGAITDAIRFDKDGSYFLIDYSPDLSDLKEGALIKFMRPGECRNAEIFFDLCKTIPVENGIPLETSGYLNAFDSYQVVRQIPTPVTVTKTVKKAVAGSSNPVVYETVDESVTSNVIKPYSWLFEHHSPSDLWGDHIANRGRPLVQNPLESVICKETEIALSGVLGVNGIVNYIHYFDEDRKKSFDNNGSGGIVAVIVKSNLLLVIFRNGWELVPYDDNSIVFDGSRAIVKSADQQIGKFLQRKGEAFGCHPLDRNTIALGEGVVSWVDRNRVALVVCDYAGASDVADNRYYQWLRLKVKAIVDSGGSRYLHQVYSPKDKQFYLTDFNRVSPTYVNDENGFNADISETVAIDAGSGKLRKACSFTPEGFASLEGDVKDEQLFAFKGGIPYSHHRIGNTSFLNFFGVQCNWAINPVVSVDPMAVKKFMSLEFYSKQITPYAPMVKTEQGQLSQVPKNFFVRGEKYSVAPFLCDINPGGLNVLTEGDNMRGRWLEVQLCSDAANRNKYFELTGIVVNVTGVKPSGTP